VATRPAGGLAFGLGDNAATYSRDDTKLIGFVEDHLLSGVGFTRMAGHFVYPQRGMAELASWRNARTY
jgi:hypothetical protein